MDTIKHDFMTKNRADNHSSRIADIDTSFMGRELRRLEKQIARGDALCPALRDRLIRRKDDLSLMFNMQAEENSGGCK